MGSAGEENGGPRSRRGHRALAERGREGQAESPFSAILTNLLESTSLSLGAAIVDFEGETVDFSGTMAPFDLKVTAAHVRILLHELAETPALGAMREIRLRAEARSYVIRVIDESYALVLLTHHRAAFAVSHRALDEAETRITGEAGLTRTPGCEAWFRVEVEMSERAKRPARLRFPSSVAYLGAPDLARARLARRADPRFSRPPEPLRLESAATWTTVEVIGAFLPKLARRPSTRRGYRIRLSNGAEMTLVAEAGGLWFVDEAPWAIFGSPT